jgi:hypothetical protein
MENELLKRIEALEKEIQDLKSVNNLSLQVQRTFEARGFLNSTQLESIDPLDWDSLNRVIPLSGSAEDITVLEYPYRWAKLNNNQADIDLYIPVYGKQNI